ncbi:MAG: Asp-tRNA(Asn)/Glu-tRNA(Gln) amidotransferase subunit GatC [Planctomycetia bacterium]|nr:Asp-tRNA(Asn)/Glu-tRNA(Gln) amidotransferase subunit GatC [Planctomycetia bacterium]
MSTLNREQVARIAHLARLELTPAELDGLTPQLDAIVDYVQRLSAVDTTDIEPLAHALDVIDAFREDEPVRSLAVEQALANSPGRRGPCFSVPAALE